MQGEKKLPLSLICSICLLHYDQEGFFFNMQRPRWYLGYAAASKERRGCLFILYAASASFLICRLQKLRDLMMLPPRREEALSFCYMQHQPLTILWRRLIFWYAEDSGIWNMLQPPWRDIYEASASYRMMKKAAFLICRGLGYLEYAAASKERRGCLFLWYAASASYSMTKKTAFLICRGLVGILDILQPLRSKEATSFSSMQYQPLIVLYKEEGFFSDMQRPRVSGIWCSL